MPSKLRCPHALIVIATVVSSPLIAQVTEAPQTVAPGKILLEMDGVTVGFDQPSGDKTKFTALGLASTILSAGITNSVDLQVGATLYLREKYQIGGERNSRSGLGDLLFRVKWTFWRDANHGAALAVLPYVKVPSDSGGAGNDAVEGGVIFPWAMAIPGGATAGAMLRWDMVRNDADNGYDALWRLTSYVRRNISSSIAVYGEGSFAAASTGFSDWEGTIGLGGLLQLTNVLQLDYELQRGVNRRAADWTHVVRLNWGW